MEDPEDPGVVRIARLLVEHGADLEARDASGQTRCSWPAGILAHWREAASAELAGRAGPRTSILFLPRSCRKAPTRKVCVRTPSTWCQGLSLDIPWCLPR